jgi:hypothetical protein
MKLLRWTGQSREVSIQIRKWVITLAMRILRVVEAVLMNGNEWWCELLCRASD